ncbi:MAG: sulfatase [bacterium]
MNSETSAVTKRIPNSTPLQPARGRPRVGLLAMLALLVGSGCATGTGDRASREARDSRPNIVLFLVDDLGQQDVSVPMLDEASALNTRYRTPNLEALAARGIRYSNAYAAAPVCTPSRTAILTGQSPARTHITYWTLEKDRDTSSRHPRLDPPDWEMNGAQPTGAELPALLAGAGYRTIHIGKAHFGARGTPGADPLNLGFEVNIAGHAAGAPGSFEGRDHFKDAARKQRGKFAPGEAPASVWDVPGLEDWHGQDVWLDDVLSREACDEIARAVTDRKPFFLNFCPYGVHVPIMEDARFAAAYPQLDATERAYATMVAAVDEALGQLIARCEALEILDETVFIFTSDNGGLSAQGRGMAPDGGRAHVHNAPLRSGKGSAYEGGLRVPFVVAGPGIAHEARPRATPIVGTDLYPTLLALAGATLPADRACDGVDLSGSWRGDAEPRERAIIFHQPHKWGPEGPGIEPFSALRFGDWKLIWFHDDAAAEGGLPRPRLELYDVAQDPGETRERSAVDTAIAAAMREQLRVILESIRAQPSRRREDQRAIRLD